MSRLSSPEFEVYPYQGTTAAYMAPVESSTACPDSLASMVRDAITFLELPVSIGIEYPDGASDTALQPTDPPITLFDSSDAPGS